MDIKKDSNVVSFDPNSRHGKKNSGHSPRPDADERRRKKKVIDRARAVLPIFQVRDNIIDAVRSNASLILVGETGSGKTTQLPQYLHEAKFSRAGMIAVTQPRRVAAMTVAKRVADEMGVQLGQEVGYTIRFEDKTGPKTLIKYMTDGMLMREIMGDSNLRRYKAIVLDEAHERTLHTDVLFALIKRIQKARKDLKVIVMSATLEAEAFAGYFNNAKVMHVKGRQHPVQVMYTHEPEPDYVDAALITTMQIHLDEPEGDILVFLTGQDEIDSMEKLLVERSQYLPAEAQKLIVAPIYAALPPEAQLLAFQPAPRGCRKVILATNIAETSITINGIKYVVDPGLVKVRTFHPKTGVDSLLVTPISQAQARQRAGRAGRESSGTCYRVYTENSFDELVNFTVPEIKRCNLSGIILELKAMGVSDVLNFGFMDKPPKETLMRALELLYALGALDNKGNLTEAIGAKMARFPLVPGFAKAILTANELGCTKEILTIVAMLSVESSPFHMPSKLKDKAQAAKRKFIHPDGDHMTLLNAFNAYMAMKGDKDWCKENFITMRTMRKAMDIRKQLTSICQLLSITASSCGSDDSVVRKCIVSGFFVNVASLQTDGMYKTCSFNQTVAIHPSSVLFKKKPEFVLYNDLVFTSKYYVRELLVIEPAWLPEVAPTFYSKRTDGIESNQGGTVAVRNKVLAGRSGAVDMNANAMRR